MALGDVHHFVEVLQLLFDNLFRLVSGNVVMHPLVRSRNSGVRAKVASAIKIPEGE